MSRAGRSARAISSTRIWRRSGSTSEVNCAASGGSEMRDFLETGETVDCVILDVLMPGEASASVVLHLKERKIPFLLISGSFDAMKYAEDNGLQFLRKPFRSQELYSSVNTALTSGEFRRAIIK